jgi:hypothetical protein
MVQLLIQPLLLQYMLLLLYAGKPSPILEGMRSHRTVLHESIGCVGVGVSQPPCCCSQEHGVCVGVGVGE